MVPPSNRVASYHQAQKDPSPLSPNWLWDLFLLLSQERLPILKQFHGGVGCPREALAVSDFLSSQPGTEGSWVAVCELQEEGTWLRAPGAEGEPRRDPLTRFFTAGSSRPLSAASSTTGMASTSGPPCRTSTVPAPSAGSAGMRSCTPTGTGTSLVSPPLLHRTHSASCSDFQGGPVLPGPRPGLAPQGTDPSFSAGKLFGEQGLQPDYLSQALALLFISCTSLNLSFLTWEREILVLSS